MSLSTKQRIPFYVSVFLFRKASISLDSTCVTRIALSALGPPILVSASSAASLTCLIASFLLERLLF
jgi:hypothetical protein